MAEFLNTEGEHQHDDTVTSLSIVQDAPLDLESVQDFVSDILQTKGADIFRMKGVLNIEHSNERFMYQAVHMIFNGTFDAPWGPNEKRESKLVFIGKNLDHDALKASFNACIASPEMAEKKRKMLRFAIGDRVECRTGKDWDVGKVVALFYRDEYMPPGMVAPYQVQLERNGTLIYAPEDKEALIRQAK